MLCVAKKDSLCALPAYLFNFWGYPTLDYRPAQA